MEPYRIHDYWVLAFCYATFEALPHMGIGIVGTIAALIAGFFRGRSALPWIAGIWIFVSALLLFGCFWNTVWNLLVFNQLYSSHDYAGWECSPFGLILNGEVDSPSRFFHGMTAGSIRGLWVIYAILSWGTAAWTTQRIMKKQKASNTPSDRTR